MQAKGYRSPQYFAKLITRIYAIRLLGYSSNGPPIRDIALRARYTLAYGEALRYPKAKRVETLKGDYDHKNG